MPHCPRRLSFLAVLCVISIKLFCGTAAHADSWLAPVLEHWSANHRFVLRVDRTTRELTLNEAHGDSETRIWKIPGVQEGTFGIPVIAYVRDDGRYVILRDQYHQVGYGKVLVFLGEKGQVLRAYTLKDLFSQSRIFRSTLSISSLWWDEPESFLFLKNSDRFGCLTCWGEVAIFDATTGERLSEQGADGDELRSSVLQIAHRELESDKDREVGNGIRLVGLLKDRESVPKLRQLLTDPSFGIMVTGVDDATRHEERFYGNQLDAGKALVRILGREAAPLLEERLTTASTTFMRASWLGRIAESGAADRSPAILRYADDIHSPLRGDAIKALIRNGGIDFVRRHPAWLQDPAEELRYRAVRCLSETGDKQDLPALRRAVRDNDRIISLWALRGLIRIAPPDLDARLRDYVRQHPEEPEAHIALADRGDAGQLRWCLDQLVQFVAGKTDSSLSDSAHHPLAISTSEIQDVTKALVRWHPTGTREVLNGLARMPGTEYHAATLFQAVGYGGLANLGDPNALTQVREIAEIGEMFSAMHAIEWLAICQDRTSIPLLRSLLNNREIEIGKAASRALQSLGIPHDEPHDDLEESSND